MSFGKGPGNAPTIFIEPSFQCRTLINVTGQGVPSTACSRGYCPAGMSPFLNSSENIGGEGVLAGTVDPEVEHNWIGSIVPGTTTLTSSSVEGPTAPVRANNATARKLRR